MFDSIVLFTHEYPFETGRASAETYLANEVPLLAKYCSRLVVVACYADGNLPIHPSFPKSAIAFGIGGDQSAVKDNLSRTERNLARVSYLQPPCAEIRSDLHRLDKSVKTREAVEFLYGSDALCRKAWDAFQRNDLTFHGSVLLYSFWFNHPCRAAILLARRIRVEWHAQATCISRAHGYDLYDYRSPFGYLPFKAWMVEHCECVFPCSRDGEEYLRRRDPSAAHRYRMLHLGVPDYGRGEPSAIPDSVFRIVACSRATRLKRVDRIIESLKLLGEEGRPVCFDYIGDGEELERLRYLAGEESNVEMKTLGYLSHDEIVEYYRRNHVDLFINASESEGIPLTIMEAQSFGIPAIVTDVGGNPEIIEDGYNGRLLPKDFKDEELAGLVRYFLQMDASDYARYCRSARKIYQASYSLETNVGELMREVSQRAAI